MTDTTEDHKDRIRIYTQRVWVEGELSGVDELFAPQAVLHGLPPMLPPTREGVQRLVQMLRAGIPDMQCTDEDLIAEGDRVVQRFRVWGTQTGPLMGIPPTGRPVDIEGYAVSRFEDGQVVERWGMFDVAGMRAQLTSEATSPAQRTASGPAEVRA